MQIDKTRLVRIVSLLVLALNCLCRLMFIRSYMSTIGMTVIVNGLLMLIGCCIITLSTRKPELIAAACLGFSAALEVMMYNTLPPIGNPFLWISVLSLIIIAVTLWIQKNGKSSILSISKIPKKRILITLIPLMLLPFFMSVGAVKASTIVGHVNLTSKDGHFRVTIYIYQHEDTVANKDFYGFWVLLHTDDVAYFDWISKLELYFPGATFDDWQPRSGLTTGGSISITPTGPSVSIGLPLSDVSVSVTYTNKLSWFVNPLGSNPQDLEFAARAWTTSGTDLKWEITISAWSYFSVCGITVFFWHDTVKYSTPLPIVYVHHRRGGHVDYYHL